MTRICKHHPKLHPLWKKKNQGFEEDKAICVNESRTLKVLCTYKSQGCDWKGEHELVCLKRSVPCKYEAIGCGEMVRVNELSEHELECKKQHLQLAILRLVHQVKTLQDLMKSYEEDEGH